MRVAPRALSPAQEHAVRELSAQTVPARTLAGLYGVSVRTIYRTLAREPLSVQTVVVGTWHAEFELHELGPIQRTEWRAVA